MSDNDIEEVTFLPATGNACIKRTHYDPSSAQRFRQVVCTKRNSLLIVTLTLAAVFCIALVAALARPPAPPCKCQANKSGVSAPRPSLPALATNGKPFPYTKIRLPRDVLPVTYDIFLRPDLETFDFSGSVLIRLLVAHSTDFVVLHVKHLNVTSASLTSGGGVGGGLHIDKVKVISMLEYTRHEQMYFQFDRHLTAGATYSLYLEFKGRLSTLLTGFYRSSYKNSHGEVRWLATTQFEPTDARAAFPCFDEPDIKANFSLRMSRPRSYIALFNTRRLRTEPDTGEFAGSRQVDTFERSVAMSTYLVAFVVCDYDNKTTTTSDGTKVSVYAPPEQIEQTTFALDMAAEVLVYYEHFFGVDYPLSKQDLIAIPDFAAGAMENWGLITYRMTTILFDKDESSVSNQQWVAVVIAHELAHQWFGNLVTMKWWNDLWLNEGFASFVEYLGVEKIHPEWKMLEQFVADTLVSALEHDSLSSSHPISVPVHDPAEINEIFDAISYDKGASLIRMLRGFLGEEALTRGLQTYLKKYQYSNAMTEHLWTEFSMESEKSINIGEVMDTWTKQMGYPLVTLTCTRTAKGMSVVASQSRFLLSQNSSIYNEFNSSYGYKWHVPLTYISSDSNDINSQNLIWMNMGSVSFTVPGNPKWLKANVEMMGFYRVHYDLENWKALIAQLKMDHKVFSTVDRASLLDDAFALARSGQLDVTIAMELSEYLIKENDFLPWSVALRSLDYIGSLLDQKPSYEYYKAYILKLMNHVVTDVGWKDEGTHLKKYLRSLVLGLAVQLNHHDSVKKAKEIFKKWTEGERVSPNLKVVVYRAGIQYGGEQEWQFAFAKCQKSTVPSERRKLMYALSASTDANILNRYLHMAVNKSQIRMGNTVSVVTHIATNPAGRLLAWHFVKKNWPLFSKRYGQGSFDMTQLIYRTTMKFASEYDYKEVEEFFARQDTGSGRRAVSQTLENINMNIAWLRLHETELQLWLQERANIGGR